MISYGGQALMVPDPMTVARIEQSLAGMVELQRPDWTGTADWRMPAFEPMRPVRLGSLFWPRSASRFAYGHFVVSDTTMKALRSQAYTGDSRGQIALPLILSSDQTGGQDPARSLTTPMFFLPPRPLNQMLPSTGDPKVPKADNLNLLTLVDERFYWWRQASTILINDSVQWKDLYSSIAFTLGLINFKNDDVSENYLFPNRHLASTNEYLPLLLDAVAYSVGQRIVRKLDGTVSAQGYDTASDISSDLYAQYANLLNGGTDRREPEGGGAMRLEVADPRRDLASLVPAMVSMRFPKLDGTFVAQQVALFALGLEEYQGVTVKNDVKIVHSSAIATDTNTDDLRDLLQQWAADWYLLQLGDVSVTLTGIVPWNNDGMTDVVEWHAYGNMRTIVSREPMNDLGLKVWHHDPISSGSSSGSSSASGQCITHFGHAELATIPEYDPTEGELFIIGEANGCAVRVGTTMCSTASGSGS